MEVHLLGTGGYHSTEERHTACIMLPVAGIVLDGGTGLFRARERLCTSSLDIFLTHIHLDHCCGVTYIQDVIFGKDVQSVTVHARPEDLTALKDHLFDGPLFPAAFKHRMKPIESPIKIGGWTIRSRLQKHPGGSLGLRLDSDVGSLAYITDTTADPADREAIDFIRGVDLLIHECYFPDSWSTRAFETGHSAAAAVGKVAKLAGAKRLILVHINPLAGEEERTTILREVAANFPSVEMGIDQAIIPL